MIPNSNTAIRALFRPHGEEDYSLPVVAWNPDGCAMVPGSNGILQRADEAPDFLHLKRDIQLVHPSH